MVALLFAAQRFDGILDSGADGLKSDGQDRNGDCCEPADAEEPPGYRGPVDEVLQPAMHKIPGDRGGDDKGQGDGPEEVEGQHSEEASDAGAEDLADTDLFLSLFYREGHEAQEAHTGNGDRDDHGQLHQTRDALFLLVEIGDGIIEKRVGELVVRV